MNCFVSEEQLALYSGNDLSPQESAAVSDHLSMCERCRATLADLRSFRKLITEIPAEPDDEDLRFVRNAVMQRVGRHRKRNRLLQTVAIAAGLVLVIALPLHRNKPHDERDLVPVTNLQALPLLPAPMLELPAIVPMKTVWHRRHKRDADLGLWTVALNRGPDGKFQLKITTADPNVIIFFPMDENTHAN